MKKLLLIFSASLSLCLPASAFGGGLVAGLSASLSSAATPDEQYQKAHECYEGVQASPELQKYRDRWEACIRQFRHIAGKYGRTASGEKAKFSLGKLYEELAQNSKNRADFRRAIGEYESFARRYSKSNLADDAWFFAGRLHWERFHSKPAAKKDLSKVTKFYKDSDTAGEAVKYMEAVNKGIVPKEKARVIPPSPPLEKGGKGGFKQATRSRTMTIVIDPGHGGSDAGAVGSNGTKEKDITLAISKRLASRLNGELKGVRVYLTRTRDATLTLNERTMLANMKGADVFISIHANASRSKRQRGIQTYYLNNATDEASRRLAEQENKNVGRKTSDLEQIIATMIQNESTERSRLLAGVVHKQLVGSLSKKYKGVVDQQVRSALFYVLVGAKSPSVLVETSYISNPKEEARLTSREYQEDVVQGIAAGLKRYIEKQSAVANL